MELRHLRYFAAIAEAGSLTAAAARLHISQPPLSVAIAQLETELGVQLLVRSSRGVMPTSAGRYLLDAASRILGEVDETVAGLKRLGTGESGTLTLAAVPVLMWRRVPELLRGFCADYPDVEVRLLDPPPWTAIDLLATGKADLAAIMVAESSGFGDQLHDDLYALDWGAVPLVGVLPPGREAPDPLPLEAFAGETLYLPHRTAAVPSLPEAVEAALARHGVVPREIRTVATIQTILPLIEAGAGCAILPDPDRASLDRFALTVRTLEPDAGVLRALVLARRGVEGPAARLAERIHRDGAPDRIRYRVTEASERQSA